MTNHETVACRTTQHCAFHGWCRRCDPAFAAVMSRVNVAIQRTDADDTHWGPLYEAIGKALRPAAVSVPPPAPRADDQAALRDRIAGVLWPLTEWDGDQLNAERAADAVLAVLPEPADRAAVLREVGWTECSPEWLAAHPGECGTAPRVSGGPDVSHWHPQQPGGPCVAGEQQNETPEAEAGCAHCGGPHAWDDCEAYTALVAAEAPHAETPDAPWHRTGGFDQHDDYRTTAPAVVAQPGKETDRG